MFDSMIPTEKVRLIKNDGQVVEDLTAIVSRESISIKGIEVDIEEGEHVERMLPTGRTERYKILESTLAPSMPIPGVGPYFRLRVRKETVIHDDGRSLVQNIGALIQGDMRGGNLTAVGTANAEVQQILNDPEMLKQAVEGFLEALVGLAKAELANSELIAYLQAVEEIKGQLETTESVEPSRLRELASTLAFLDSANGTVDLLYKAWPQVYGLISIAAAMLS